VAELEYERDRYLPYYIERLYNLEVILAAYSARDAENARRAKDLLFGVQNSRKARRGMLAGLLDPELMATKRREEQELREKARGGDEQGGENPWKEIEEAQDAIAKHARTYRMLENGDGFMSSLFRIARTLVRAADELPKPNGERLREFADAGLPSLELALFSKKPIYDDLEQLTLANALTWFATRSGYDSPLVRRVLRGKSPQERAVELVLGTRLKDVEFRRKLYAGGKEAIAAADDPMIDLVRSIDDEARAERAIIEAQEERKQQAYAQIAATRFQLKGTSHYPDATFTLRLAFGTVRRYEEQGQSVPYQTRIDGLYERAAKQEYRPPFDLPKRWLDRKKSLDLSVPVNFVSTCDIIGGNSGSPVINREAELVGLIFDGNTHSLVLDYAYTDEQARAISVHTAVMTEALRKVYDAGFLADELMSRGK
jgi:hypothetical protein